MRSHFYLHFYLIPVRRGMFWHCPKSHCGEGGYHIVNIVNNHHTPPPRSLLCHSGAVRLATSRVINCLASFKPVLTNNYLHYCPKAVRGCGTPCVDANEPNSQHPLSIHHPFSLSPPTSKVRPSSVIDAMPSCCSTWGALVPRHHLSCALCVRWSHSLSLTINNVFYPCIGTWILSTVYHWHNANRS